MVRTKTLVLYHNGHGQLWVPNVTTKVNAADPLCVRAPEPGEPRLTARWHAECWYGPLPNTSRSVAHPFLLAAVHSKFIGERLALRLSRSCDHFR